MVLSPKDNNNIIIQKYFSKMKYIVLIPSKGSKYPAIFDYRIYGLYWLVLCGQLQSISILFNNFDSLHYESTEFVIFCHLYIIVGFIIPIFKYFKRFILFSDSILNEDIFIKPL